MTGGYFATGRCRQPETPRDFRGEPGCPGQASPPANAIGASIIIAADADAVSA